MTQRLTGFVILYRRVVRIEVLHLLESEAEASGRKAVVLRKSAHHLVRKAISQNSCQVPMDGESKMVTIGRIEARAHARATEVLERVETAIINIFPSSVRESLKISRMKVEGHAHIQMSIVAAVLTSEKACEVALDYLIASLDPKDKRSIVRTIDLRIDEQCNFFLRIDKQEAFLERLHLAAGPDVISVQVHFRHYPRCSPEDALEYLSERLGDVGGIS
jgi:RNA binding exosome subunit